jgi:Spy/CpxP family protein refolding chaperone
MKRPSSKLIVTTLIAAGAVVAVPVFAHGHGGGCGPMSHAGAFGAYGDTEAGIERMAHHLDLTKDQLSAVRAIVDKDRPQLRALLDQLAGNHRQLRELKKQSPLDEGQLRTLADAQGKAIADMTVLRTEMRADIDKVLTEEQRQKMEHNQHKDMWRSQDS